MTMAIDKNHQRMIGPYSCSRNCFYHDFLDILDAYENADDLRRQFMNGANIKDELFDRLSCHDEDAADALIRQ